MIQMLTFLQNWGAYAIMVIAAFTWKLWVPKLIDYALDKKIIKYKTDLETEKEKQLAEYGKSITGFNKLFDKKYEIYPILYSKIIRLHGELSAWSPMQSWADFDRLTSDEFAEYLDTFGFFKPDKRLLIEKKACGEITYKDLEKLLPDHFRQRLGITNNYLLMNSLFLSREIEGLVKKFISDSHRIGIGYSSVFSSFSERKLWDEIDTILKSNDQLVVDILCRMRAELEHGISCNNLSEQES